MFLSQLFSILDARSFSSPWFWLVLFAVWTLSGRGVLGVPNDVLGDAGRALRREPAEAEPEEAVLLLNWLSLQLPRWQIGRTGGAVLTAAICFGLSALLLLGFRYGLEMAQALTLLALPVALLFVLRVRLAQKLRPVLTAAERGAPVRDAAAAAIKRINTYRILHTLISVLAVMVTTLYASFWMLLHPNGL
ncbi:hypothetical protein [Paracoccus sp. SCSIO 75233]|uniref:hypothetical protein n=1 Tax=Paracoccus sp. SCSIO 75233 TaxID=3017782 RepID=UPI0022F045CE|nr:hypothetical protein [Paracoccus sp. SCSIO 75233]WBU52152.1 hypothetical protein PAF12_09915 [Paracoccus sp. SCSIO 75233]